MCRFSGRVFADCAARRRYFILETVPAPWASCSVLLQSVRAGVPDVSGNDGRQYCVETVEAMTSRFEPSVDVRYRCSLCVTAFSVQ